MPSPPILDLETLLTPIEGDNPSGESLRYAGTYDAIQEARRSDDELDRGEWVREVKTADWQGVVDLATEALATRSKDLQIAVWLIEGLVKRHGFAGLRDGLRLLWELQARFWDSLHPQMEEEEDIEFRTAPLEWLNDKLPPSIVQIPVTQGLGGETYSWLRWEESRMVDNLGRRDEEAMQAAIAEGKITGEQFDKAMETTPLEYYRALFEDLNQVGEEYDQLDKVVDDKYGRAGPSLMGVKKVVEECRTLIEDILKKRGGLEPDQPTLVTPAEPETGPEAKAATGQASESTPGQAAPRPVTAAALPLEPQDRADALRRLAAVAEYFRRTEPHSPVAYLVQRAVRWGGMPLEDWLQYVIHDATVLDSVRETLGLNDTVNSGTPAYQDEYQEQQQGDNQE
jgi:type VI secretion system protein ImpA